jgi:hypothetical protein
MLNKELLSAAAMGLTFSMFFPYIRSIQRGKTKPHVFSWVIWGMSTLIVFFAQLAGHGGLGAFPIGFSGVITSYIALLAYLKRADTLIAKADWIFFLTALSALPFWFLTSDPLWAVVILTTVDVMGFGPTVRRAYHHPNEERISLFALGAARNLLVIFALEFYSMTTVLFPAVAGLASLCLVFLLAYRRHSLAVDSAELRDV